MLHVPGRQRLNFVDFRFPGLFGGFIAHIGSPQGRWIPLLALVPVLLLGVAAFVAIGPGLLIGRLLIAAIAGVIGGAALWIGLGLYAYRALRALETADVPDTRDPDLLRRLRITARENPPGHEQSHIISASDFKPGRLRRLSFAFAMWGIGVFARHYTRPGFILSMGTIHFARWLRLPDAEKLIFFSNYDGSWESYLEDFITKAHAGQTAAWSHGVGFPPAVGLIGEGAKNGDLFKRWVRRQQQLTGCWYSALPHLTLDRIRAQALIHHGLARAGDAAAARDWLDLLGALPRPAATVETAQVQSLVFRSLGSLQHGAHIFLNFPASAPGTALSRIVGGEGALPPVIFGDMPSGSARVAAAAAIALSPVGLARLGLPGPHSAQGLASFPLAFMAGMAARADILGDSGEWLPPGSGQPGLVAYDRCDAVLMLVADTAARVAAAIADLGTIVTIVDSVITGPTTTAPDGRPGLDHDHFGFRDGVSQPAIRGTGDWRERPARDTLAAGEFLLGHPASAGYTAPPLRLAAEHDPAGLLPGTAEPARPYPDFTASGAFRDFGRNGSFVVVRRLKQDVAGFHNGTAAAASDLVSRCPHLPAAIHQEIDGPWLQARIIGRWPDGTPVIDRAGAKGHSGARNDFSFGIEDPQGLACPLGAHIRRANPRDSLDPADPLAWDLSNRHRIIRRGRPFDTGSEKGLMFTAICADIERQFEFVQQRWLLGRSFHGLPGEVDPLLGQGDFTLPTSVGPVRVHGLASWVATQGGGYFFLPGRAALHWLAQARRTG
jgi:Dyp-type peroxidase family